MLLIVLRRNGPEWVRGLPVEQQTGWEAHARFMDGLVDAGHLVLGGPLADEERVVLIMEAASPAAVRDLLAGDPWSESMLRIESVERWTIRLDGRPPRR